MSVSCKSSAIVARATENVAKGLHLRRDRAAGLFLRVPATLSLRSGTGKMRRACDLLA